jgi:hypothetical protein
MPGPRKAASVTAVLRKAGITTGLRYTQTGYMRHGVPNKEYPGVMVTRNHKSRYGGLEDYGCVMIFPVADAHGTGTPDDEFIDRIKQALDASNLKYTTKGCNIAVHDEEG